jgi:peptidoglycan/LPS O-acetylase OafA/YrhL
MSVGVIVVGGDISYSLYLGHPLVGGIAALPLDFRSKTLGLAIEFLIACIIACGLYSIIEMPMKRLVRRTFSAARIPVRASTVPAE